MSTLGEILKNERQRRAMSLHEISKRTNISEKMLKAMENDQFHLIPGRFYVLNFLKTYIHALGIEEKSFFSSNEAAIKKTVPPDHDTPPAYYAKLRYSRFKRHRLVIILVILILILLVSAALLYLKSGDNLTSWLFRSPPAGDVPALGLAVDPVWHFQSRDYAPVVVRVIPEDVCWIEARRGRRTLVRRLLRPGMSQILSGYEITLTMGNPSSVLLTFNSRQLGEFRNRTRPTTVVFRPDKFTTSHNP